MTKKQAIQKIEALGINVSEVKLYPPPADSDVFAFKFTFVNKRSKLTHTGYIRKTGKLFYI